MLADQNQSCFNGNLHVAGDFLVTWCGYEIQYIEPDLVVGHKSLDLSKGSL